MIILYMGLGLIAISLVGKILIYISIYLVKKFPILGDISNISFWIYRMIWSVIGIFILIFIIGIVVTSLGFV